MIKRGIMSIGLVCMISFCVLSNIQHKEERVIESSSSLSAQQINDIVHKVIPSEEIANEVLGDIEESIELEDVETNPKLVITLPTGDKQEVIIADMVGDALDTLESEEVQSALDEITIKGKEYVDRIVKDLELPDVTDPESLQHYMNNSKSVDEVLDTMYSDILPGDIATAMNTVINIVKDEHPEVTVLYKDMIDRVRVIFSGLSESLGI